MIKSSTILRLEENVKRKREKINRTERELFQLKERHKTGKLLKAGKVIEAAGLLDNFNFDKTLQVLLQHKGECL